LYRSGCSVVGIESPWEDYKNLTDLYLVDTN